MVRMFNGKHTRILRNGFNFILGSFLSSPTSDICNENSIGNFLSLFPLNCIFIIKMKKDE